MLVPQTAFSAGYPQGPHIILTVLSTELTAYPHTYAHFGRFSRPFCLPGSPSAEQRVINKFTPLFRDLPRYATFQKTADPNILQVGR